MLAFLCFYAYLPTFEYYFCQFRFMGLSFLKADLLIYLRISTLSSTGELLVCKILCFHIIFTGFEQTLKNVFPFISSMFDISCLISKIFELKHFSLETRKESLTKGFILYYNSTPSRGFTKIMQIYK